MTYDKWKTTEPDDIKDRFERGEDEREELYAEIERLRAINAELLAAAKNSLSILSKLDDDIDYSGPGYMMLEDYVPALKAAIAAAEKRTP